jgi:hypothetical protein
MDQIKIFGIKLLMTKVALVGAEKFFRQTQIDKWNLPDSAGNGPKIVTDVLWMRMLEASEGMKLPNGCRWFYYISFWGSKPKFYRFRTNPILDCMNLQDVYPATTKWTIHSLKEA